MGFLALTLGIIDVGTAGAGELLINGGFNAGGGSLSGWTVVDQPGSAPLSTWYAQSGGTLLSPVSGFPVPAAPTSDVAMADQTGNGSHVIYQDFAIPAGPITSATLELNLWVGNRSGAFFTPDTLDFNVFPNQQARIDLLTPSGDPFSLTDVLLNAYQTRPGDPLVLPGYITLTEDVTGLIASHAGSTLRLRAAETDNTGFFQFAFTASLTAVREPSSLALAAVACVVLITVALSRWRSRRPVAA
jgi:hypothetical protein